jgi:hypothetical protein
LELPIVSSLPAPFKINPLRVYLLPIRKIHKTSSFLPGSAQFAGDPHDCIVRIAPLVSSVFLQLDNIGYIGMADCISQQPVPVKDWMAFLFVD